MTPSSYLLTVVRVIALDQDGIPTSYFEEQLARIWVTVPAWSPRRAFLTGVQPFAQAAHCAPADLVGRLFFARLDLEHPPTSYGDVGERLEWPELSPCPTPTQPPAGR
ncbi:hypothetical protein [Streptomyces sp. NPDC101455]|uniref:hypothetical protein n=1 Tax=Streptomyces sp. NPDC101455 TaxID=3366142 RepID=UPI00382B9427